jgi:hypothetical protein
MMHDNQQSFQEFVYVLFNAASKYQLVFLVLLSVFRIYQGPFTPSVMFLMFWGWMKMMLELVCELGARLDHFKLVLVGNGQLR